MTQLAIIGHKTRGKEVIEILEMLGGRNLHNYSADCDSLCFYISKETNIIYYDWVRDCCEDEDVLVFTLEKFLEKFPYKSGDKVQHKGAISCGSVFEVEKMRWEENTVKYTLRLFGCNYKTSTLSAEYLQPYKEETMEEDSILNQLIKYFKNTPRDVIEKEWHEYDKYNEIGPTVKEYLESINKSKYPKTYDECVNMFNNTVEALDYKKIRDLNELIYCRNTYWKIAGEQMGLGKPWEPNWLNEEQDKFVLYTHNNVICSNRFVFGHNVFAFPTAEMRDAFYENFKKLIEACKELL
jgi:hypothetical protein